MERRNFLKSCGYACASGISVLAIVQSCTTTKTINGAILESDLVLDLNEFEIIRKGQKSYREYIILQNEVLKHSICVYRFSDTDFSALYLECTHQGAELQVFGDKIQCPAHGAEFTNKGQVTHGPAETKLRTFPTRIENQQLKISLK